MSPDRISNISLGVSLCLHAVLIIGFGAMKLQTTAPLPMLIEVTLAGSSAPYSVSEGIKAGGKTIASREREEQGQGSMSPEETKAWQDRRRREIIRELAKSRAGLKLGASKNKLRQGNQGLAEGRGAGDFGQPGSPQGTLSFTGAIAARGFQEPDFSMLKSLITEETQLRLRMIVLPGGEVKKCLLLETSGYPYVDQKAIELARMIAFDPLPSNWKQVEQQGILTIKLKL